LQAVGRGGESIPLDAPEMRKSMAWDFALMAIKKQEIAQAERMLLLSTHPNTEIRDVQVNVWLCCIWNCKAPGGPDLFKYLLSLGFSPNSERLLVIFTRGLDYQTDHSSTFPAGWSGFSILFDKEIPNLAYRLSQTFVSEE
jgi:hypothetical protein